MKRILPLCLVVFILLGYMFPVQPVKADQGTEVTFTDSQYSQIGAWALANNLIRGITDNYDFGNISARAPMTPADFLIALGESIVTGNPTPLVEFGYNVAEDVVNELSSDLQDLWEGAKDFFYELFFGSPQSTLSIDDFIQPSLQFGLDQLDKVLSEQSDGDVTYLPEDYLWFQNVNWLFLIDTEFMNGQFYPRYGDTAYVPNNSLSDYSYFIVSAFDSTNNSTNPHISGNAYAFNLDACLPKITFNYDTSSNALTYSAFTANSSVFSTYAMMRMYKSGEKIIVQNQGSYSFNVPGTFDGINSCLNWIYSHFYNINFYVDGQLWVGGNPPSPPVSSGQLTYPNGEPAIREFPSGTQIDWDELYNRIYQAIVDGLVLDFSDIDDCIVDVNGQSAVASLRLVRTDYDKLYLEQYGNNITLPYFPSTLTTGEAQAVVGGTVGNIISPYNPSNPALNEDSVIPSDIARVLYIGVFLTLFACIINRLLE